MRPTSLEGVLLIEPAIYRDDRGLFLQTYHRKQFAEQGIAVDFVQDNHSGSRRGVLRGIHFQDMTAPMAKLVRCTAGRIFDVAVDLRAGSPTFGRWEGVELAAETMQALLVPVGFGHAFQALSDWTDVEYKCSGFYTPSAERTIAWNDPDLAIHWPIKDPLLSPKDQKGMALVAYRNEPAFRYRLP